MIKERSLLNGTLTNGIDAEYAGSYGHLRILIFLQKAEYTNLKQTGIGMEEFDER